MSMYEPELLRTVGMKLAYEEYRLELYDLHKKDRQGKSILGYKFYKLSDPQHPIFDGDDFHCSPCHEIDSLETMRTCLSFLTTCPGDTDKEYFENYTEAQMEFANSDDCDHLQMYAIEDDPYPFDYDDFDLS